MDPNLSSLELLAHFDRPKVFAMPEFEGVDELLAGGSSTIPIDHVAPPQPISDEAIGLPQAKTRGIRCVLQWAVALAVLAIGTGVLIEFKYLLAAEHKLAMAARAGAREATLPRATYQSVTAAVERQLTSYPQLASQLQITLTQNGSPGPRQIRQNDGDRFVVSLAAPSAAVVPGWLQRIMPWRGDSRIQAQAERRMPGRKLVGAFGAGSGIRRGSPDPAETVTEGLLTRYRVVGDLRSALVRGPETRAQLETRAQ